MRHGKKLNHLGRKTGHRRAMMANMASSLIKHKKITTTVAKAKALRVYVEPLITKSKEKSTTNYRTVFSYLMDKEAVTELFSVVSDKVSERPGGYTRILKVGNRAGDNADMAMIELVDFNEYFDGFNKDKKADSKRTRRGRGKSAGASEKVEKKEETPVVEEVVVEDAIEATPEVEATVDAVADAAAEEVVVEEVQTEDVQEATESTEAPNAENTDESSEDAKA